MIGLLLLYVWAILAGTAAAPGLAILGVQLATRDRAMQILCIGQGALLGVLLGIGLLQGEVGNLMGTVGPFLSALLVSSLTYAITESTIREKAASKNTTFAFIFGLLIAVSHLVSALFPGLQSHMSQIYFGDLATLSVFDSKVMLGASLVFLATLLLMTKAVSRNSFESAVFGKILSESGQRTDRIFKFLTLAVLCLSVQFVGFLFTITVLFIPTAITSQLRARGLTLHLALCGALASTATVGGFLLSLWESSLPTVPSIVFLLFLEGMAVLGIEKLMLFRKSRQQVRVPVTSEGMA